MAQFVDELFGVEDELRRRAFAEGGDALGDFGKGTAWIGHRGQDTHVLADLYIVRQFAVQ